MRLRPHIILIFLFAYLTNYAQVKYSTVANGSWSNSSVWDNGVPPNPLPQLDTIYVNHDLSYDDSQIVQGVFFIDTNGSITNSSKDLFIGNNSQNEGEFFNYGSISVSKLEVIPTGCGSNNTKPVVHNFGNITCSAKIHIGKNCGSGFFFNYLGSNVSTASELHLDGYLCNEDTIEVQTRIYNHGGTIECCGYFITPKMETDQNQGRPGGYYCSNFCTDQQTEPIIEVDGNIFPSYLNAYLYASPSSVFFDNDSTLICNYNQSGDSISFDTCNAAFSYSSAYCLDGDDMSPNYIEDSSGFFYSNSPLFFQDSILGIVDVLSLDTGLYTIYHQLDNCIDSSSFHIYSATFAFTSPYYCDGDSIISPIVYGSNSGVFSADLSAMITFNSIFTGEIDVANSYDTTYSIYYNVLGCIDTVDLEIVSDEFSYPSSSYCVGGANPFPVIEGSSGGVFSSDLPLLISSSTGEIALLNAIDTNYTIYYDLLTCRDSFSLSILSAAFAYDSIFYCSSSSDPSPLFLGSPNGVFSSSSTLAIDSLSGLISLQSSLDTLHAIYYQIGSCIDTFTLELINASFSYLDTTFCFGEIADTVVLNGSNSGFFSISPADVSIDSSSGVINFAAASSSIYTVTHLLGGCSTDFSLLVENPTFSYIDSIYCSYDEPDSALYASNAGTFSSFPLGISFLDVNSGLIDFNNSSDMSYSILHTVGECVDTFDLTVVNVNGNGFFADSVCGLAYQVDQSIINEVSYLWNTLDTGLVFSYDTVFNPIVSVSSQGIYFFDCSLSKKGCIYSDSIELKFVDSIYLSLQNELVVNQSSVELLANSNAYYYQWENVSLNEGDIESPFTANTLISNLITGDYTIGVTASNDICPDAYRQVELFVDWIFIPNGFSPNGDGINDNFGLDGARDGVDFELQIVNRWGELVYVSSDVFDQWDGTIFGKEAPEDTYFYFIELSGVRYKGSLELRR